ncbi:MAG: PHB depolymerase family esterase [Myxococcales bacterium]|nr:PHB depolymerase family esterase [Myxococcales bacterium]
MKTTLLLTSLFVFGCSGPMAMASADAGSLLSIGPGDDPRTQVADAGTNDAGTNDAGSTTDAGSGAIDAGQGDGGLDPLRAALLRARPYTLRAPAGTVTGPMPLVILLHGYGATGQVQNLYFGLNAQSDRSGFLLATPDGTIDASNRRFWNATDACCNFAAATVDDVEYLHAIIDDAQRRHAVDAKRVFLIGHSNGGFMSHRMACDASSRIAAIVSFAGATWKNAMQCPAQPGVSVLQVHGTMDGTIAYGGGNLQGVEFPGAVETAAQWAQRNGCGPKATVGAVDLISTLAGDETTQERYSGCTAGAVELWTMQGGSHTPSFNTATWSASIVGFLLAHPKP